MTPHDPHDTIALWLEEGPVAVPADRRRRMLGEILVTPQPRGWRTRIRATAAFSPINLGLSAAVVVIVAAALGLDPWRPDIVGPLAPPSPSTSVGPVASADSSCKAAPAAAPNLTPPTTQPTQGPYSAGGRSLDGRPLPAGTIELDALDPPISVRLGPGWWMADDGDPVHSPPGRAAIERQLDAGGFVRIGFWDTTGLTITHPTTRQEMSAPSDFVRFLLGMESIGGCVLTSLQLDGMTATRVDFDWTSDWETWFIRPIEGGRDPGMEFHPAERQHWVIAGDGRLLIQWTVESSPGSASTLPQVRSQNNIVRDRPASEFEADRLVEHMLETVERSPDS